MVIFDIYLFFDVDTYAHYILVLVDVVAAV